jgi:hypothetical protein
MAAGNVSPPLPAPDRDQERDRGKELKPLVWNLDRSLSALDPNAEISQPGSVLAGMPDIWRAIREVFPNSPASTIGFITICK